MMEQVKVCCEETDSILIAACYLMGDAIEFAEHENRELWLQLRKDRKMLEEIGGRLARIANKR